jgi:hypothetical protein
MQPDRRYPCEKWLLDYLAERSGEARAADILTACPWSQRTLREAKRSLDVEDNVVVEHDDVDRPARRYSVWRLPTPRPSADQVRRAMSWLAGRLACTTPVRTLRSEAAVLGHDPAAVRRAARLVGAVVVEREGVRCWAIRKTFLRRMESAAKYGTPVTTPPRPGSTR